MERREFIKGSGLVLGLFSFAPAIALGYFIPKDKFVISQFMKKLDRNSPYGYGEIIIAGENAIETILSLRKEVIKGGREKLTERYLCSNDSGGDMKYFIYNELEYPGLCEEETIVNFPTKKEAVKFILDNKEFGLEDCFIKNLRTEELVPISKII